MMFLDSLSGRANGSVNLVAGSEPSSGPFSVPPLVGSQPVTSVVNVMYPPVRAQLEEPFLFCTSPLLRSTNDYIRGRNAVHPPSSSPARVHFLFLYPPAEIDQRITSRGECCAST